MSWGIRPTLDANCKSNFQSVMNYMFQSDLLGPNSDVLDFSSQQLNALHENSVSILSTSGIAFPTTTWYDTTPPLVGSKARHHCDGSPMFFNTDVTPIMYPHLNQPIPAFWPAPLDINFDGTIDTSALGFRGYNDWANIDLRQIGASGSDISGAGHLGGGPGHLGGGPGHLGGGPGHLGGGPGKNEEIDFETANSVTRSPRNLTATENDSPRFVTLNWMPPTFGQIGAYNVYKSQNGDTGPFNFLASVDGTTTSYKDNSVVGACNPPNVYAYFVTSVLAGTFTTPPPERAQGQESTPSNIVSTGSNPLGNGKLTGCYTLSVFLSPDGSALHGSIVPITWTLQDDYNFNTANGFVSNKGANTLFAIGPVPGTCASGQTRILLNGNPTLQSGASTFPDASNGHFTFKWDTDGFCAGSYTFQLTLDSGQTQMTSGATQLSIDVTDTDNPQITTTSLQNGVVGSPYSSILFQDGGVSRIGNPFTWCVVSVSTCVNSGSPLPPGISLSVANDGVSGLISGTPTTPGTNTFTVRVTDSANNTATQTLTLNVADALFGDLVVVDGGPAVSPGGTLLRVTQSGTATGTIATISTGQPSGVAVDASSGNIYAAVARVAGSGTPGVTQVTQFGIVNNSFVSGAPLQNPVAVAVDASGNVYVGDNQADAIYKFDSTGKRVGANAFASLPASSVMHVRMAFDTNGNLIVASDKVNGASGVIEVDRINASGTPAVLYNTTTNAGLTDMLTAVNASADITSFAIANNVVTFQATNTFAAGTMVQINGLTTGTYLNGQTLTVLSAGLSGMQFEANFNNSDVSSTDDSGTATSQTAAYTGTFSPPLPVGSPVAISGFTNNGNNSPINSPFTVVSCTGTTLVVNNPNGVTETHAGTATFGIASVGGVATFSDGSIDVADSSMQTIYKITITTTTSSAVAPDVGTTNALCCNISGMTNPSQGTTLFVTLDQTAQVQKAVPPSTVTTIPNGNLLTFPNDVAWYDLPAPQPPTNLSTAVHGSAQAPPVSVVVSWNASASNNLTGYNVYRATASGGPYGKLTSAPTTSLNFTDTTVIFGQAYYYVVTAVGTNSVESPYSQQVSATP